MTDRIGTVSAATGSNGSREGLASTALGLPLTYAITESRTHGEPKQLIGYPLPQGFLRCRIVRMGERGLEIEAVVDVDQCRRATFRTGLSLLPALAVDERGEVVVGELRDVDLLEAAGSAVLLYGIADRSGASRARQQPLLERVERTGALRDLLAQRVVEILGQVVELTPEIAFPAARTASR